MTQQNFDHILRTLPLPIGKLLSDGTTYRVTEKDFARLGNHEQYLLSNFDKFLALTRDGKVVGGVLFYGPVDLQIQVFPEYQGKGYMSAIHKNGILKRECYKCQQVSLEPCEINSMEDFLLRHHMLKTAGIPIKNLPEVYRHLGFLGAEEVRESSEKQFVEKYTI